jgi:hypothetical protein
LIIKGLWYSEWKKLSNSIRKRDKYKCQICGKKNCILHVHHIDPYKSSKNNDPKNLITLCIECHAKQHTNKNVMEAIRKNKTYSYILFIKDFSLLKPCNIKKIENYLPPEWHLWVYGGYKIKTSTALIVKNYTVPQ